MLALFSSFSLYHSKQKLSVMGDSFCAHNNNATKYTPISMLTKSYVADDTTLIK